MVDYELKAYAAERVVIGVENNSYRKKLFQINLTSKDGSIFVEIPYADLGIGRVGIVDILSGPITSFKFGHQAPVTAHSIKYSHHPDGEAHFSQDGKVFTKIRRKAVPLTSADGHLFTVIIQGLEHFADFTSRDKGTPRRGVVPMKISSNKVEALKFVGHLYSSQELAKRSPTPKMESEFIPIMTPQGVTKTGVVLATKLAKDAVQYLLVVSVEEIEKVSKDKDLYVSLLGGFDRPEIAFDQSKKMSFLMMFYPETNDLRSLLESVGSIDRG